MSKLKFARSLYPKIALLKAAYNYTDIAYLHLDADNAYYYVSIEEKPGAAEITEKEFLNEMLAQSVRHEVYSQTRNIRELLLARAMATSVIVNEDATSETEDDGRFDENEILKDWFECNDETVPR